MTLWPALATDLPTLFAIVIFLLTYFVVAVGRFPGFHIDRTGAALIGASLMLASGVMDLKDAYRAVDDDTLLLLLGMMIVVASLRISGAFRLVGYWLTRYIRHPIALLAVVIIGSGVLSAFLVNDTICLVVTPLVLSMTLGLKRNPMPYLLATAMAANVGSVATITGNPQNMLIGSLSGISYASFSGALTPVAVAGLGVVGVLLWAAYRGEFSTPLDRWIETTKPRYHGPMAVKAALVTVAMIAAFFLGIPAPKVAITAGGILLISRRAKPDKIYRELDFSLLLLFAGLFVVTAGVEKALITDRVIAEAGRWHLDRVGVLAGVSAVLSNLVSNVPAVLVLKPFVQHMANARQGWLVLAMASTLAGNFTILGSVANLIVVERARREGVDISFGEYFRWGSIVTVVTLAIGVWWFG